MYFRNSRLRAWSQSGTVNAYAGVRLYGVVNQWPQYCRQNVRVQNEGVWRPTRVSISSRDVISSPIHSTVRMPRTNLFNIDRLAFVRNAPVKHQCSGDYFYGQDEKLEKAIRFQEGSYATALSAILQPRFMLDQGHRVGLRRFWLFQDMRTEAASRRAVEMQGGRHGW